MVDVVHRSSSFRAPRGSFNTSTEKCKTSLNAHVRARNDISRGTDLPSSTETHPPHFCHRCISCFCHAGTTWWRVEASRRAYYKDLGGWGPRADLSFECYMHLPIYAPTPSPGYCAWRFSWFHTATKWQSSALLDRRQHQALRILIPNRFTNIIDQDVVVIAEETKGRSTKGIQGLSL